MTAVLALALAAAAAGADPCPPAEDRPCAKAALERQVAALAAAAGFAPGRLKLAIVRRDDKGGNYENGEISVTDTALREASLDELAYIAAHEVGHAVQDREGLLAEYVRLDLGVLDWTNAAPGREKKQAPAYPAWAAYSRRVEAHADAVAVELLTRTGQGPGRYGRGAQIRFGCMPEDFDPAQSHPVRQEILVTAALAQEPLRRVHAALADGARAFDGTAARPAAPAVPAWTPAARLDDFDSRGALRPGRLVAESLKPAPPPPGAGTLESAWKSYSRKFVTFWLADPFGAAIDRFIDRRGVASAVLSACGTPRAAAVAEEFGPAEWADRLARDAAARLWGAVRGEAAP